MSESAPSDRVEEIYRGRIRELNENRETLLDRFTLLSRLRAGTFIAAMIPLLLIETSPPGRRILLAALGVGLLLGFVALVIRHRRVRLALEELDSRIRFSKDGLARGERDWSHLPDPDDPSPAPDHPYAGDLDVSGRASLLHILGTAVTLPGRSALRSWLLDHPPLAQVAPRQNAVRDLASRFSLREDLWVRSGNVRGEDENALEGFIAWAEAGGEDPVLSPLQLWAAGMLPVTTFVLLGLHLSGALAFPFWLLPIGAVFLLDRGARDDIHAVFDAAEGVEASTRTYAGLLERLGDEEFEAPRLQEIGERVREGGAPAHEALDSLRRGLDLAAVRYSGLSHAPLRLLFAWDFHVVNRLDRWRSLHGHRVRGWIDGLGETEALAALGALAHDHPGWTFPEVKDSSDGGNRVLRGVEVGHPLLPPDRCVRNEVEVGPPGTFLLVTGSNMSGKSTLLRAVGLNAVLARAGGPVCASSLTMPVVNVHTSMRIRDSLEAGLSLFMAELRRLRMVVDAAREGDGGGNPSLFLLDEILQGTNTVERRIAARTVLRHLTGTGAIGAVTTHDLTLASAPDLEQRARAVHFRETIREEEGGSILDFDYTLRPGLATTRNALQLMKLVGLEPPEGT